ncbi:MAG: signal recognition particle-docking protein FtsY [Eubacteriales bacterium]|nr:signal recognition particle-docking protein FtsY [Eubacteriales bacterium]
MPAEEPEVLEEVPVEAPAKKGFFQKLVEGLTKTRDHVMQGVNDVLSSFTSIDEEFYEELEEALIIGDLGVNTAIKIVEGLKQKVKERKIKEPQAVKALLKEELKEQMYTQPEAYDFIQKKSVILVIGVNGVGKTTTIGKLASQYKKAGKTVMLAAADTFRAAAIDQLKEWANRADVPIVAQAENSDPGAVIFDAIASAKSRGTDILICDTAGRLHNKKNLMAELAKIYRIIGREYPEAHLEVFLVLDSTTGQNALAQAKEFKEMADITGIVLTKLDGTSKGGIAIAISADLKLPVKYIGVGEGIDDLRPFDADSFVEALFEE